MLRIPQHEQTHGLFDIPLLEEDTCDLLGDRQFDMECRGEFQCGPSRGDALRHRLAFRQHLVERAPFRQLQAERAVATQRAGAGGDQIAQTRQPGQRQRIGASREISASARVINAALAFSP